MSEGDVSNAIFKILEKELKNVKLEMKTQNPYLVLLKENDYSETPFTLKEIEVIEQVHRGFSNPQIADKLFISLSTVKTHVSNIFKKFQIKNRKDLKEIISKIID